MERFKTFHFTAASWTLRRFSEWLRNHVHIDPRCWSCAPARLDAFPPVRTAGTFGTFHLSAGYVTASHRDFIVKADALSVRRGYDWRSVWDARETDNLAAQGMRGLNRGRQEK